MTISMYKASVPIFKQMLSALNEIILKVKQNNKADEAHLMHARLFEDMFDFTRQVQIATDFAKGVTGRLAGRELPTFEDNETTLDELQARIEKTLKFLSEVSPQEIDGSETREIVTRPGTPKEKKFHGETYLLHYGLPQFFFHVTTAYDILRNNGIEIGKKDYMGHF